MWIFKDYIAGEEAIFSTKSKAKEFCKKFANKVYDDTGIFPDRNEFEIKEIEIDPDFKKWWKNQEEC